jgi:hypothetical protein
VILLVSLFKSSACILCIDTAITQGLALYADPDFKVLAASYPYFAKRLLTDPNPYLRDALIELLFKDGRFRQVPADLYICCCVLIDQSITRDSIV